MKKLFLLLLIAPALLFFQCEQSNSTPDNPNDPNTPVEHLSQVVKMNQVLGWKLFNQEQIANPGKNVLISPYSIQTALFMAQNGAKGATLNEMLEMMDCKGCSVTDLNARHRELNTLLTNPGHHAKLTVANAFFYDQARIIVQPPFLATLSSSYDAGAQNLNFGAEQAALQTINGWVNQKTQGKIDKILERIDAFDVAFLINALHFKSDWATGFSPELTFRAPFTKADGSVIQVDYVNADRDFSIAQTVNHILVDIPFKDSIFSMSFIMPSANNTNSAWHRSITHETWPKLYQGMTYGRAMVYFPKLKLAYDRELIPSLQALGMQAAFNERTADFTPMGVSPSGKNIFIKQVKHKAVLEVDEKGAEGAAVTSIGFGVTSMPQQFFFNRPFVLVLRHIPTNSMIFAGYVADPAI